MIQLTQNSPTCANIGQNPLKTPQPIAKPLRRTSGNQILPFFSSFFPYRQVIFKWQPYATNGAISVPKRTPLTTNNVGFKPPNPIQILG